MGILRLHRNTSRLRLASLGTISACLFALAAAADVRVELRSAVDPSGFTEGPDDCRDTSPASCRGLLTVDVEASPALAGVYVAFDVTNEAALPRSDVWVSLAGFDDADAANLVRPAPGQADDPALPEADWSASLQIGPLGSGESRTVFFLLEVVDPTRPLPTGPEVRPDLAVWEGVPGDGAPLPANPALPPCPSPGRACAQPDGSLEWPFVYADTLASSPNQILDIGLDPAAPLVVGDPLEIVGGSLEITVLGQTGNLGVLADYDRDGLLDAPILLTPSALASWPARELELAGSELVLSGVDACGLADCTCSQDPPAAGACDFAREDGGPPTCQLLTPQPTCVVAAASDRLEVIAPSTGPFDYVARYDFRVRGAASTTPLAPLQYVTSGAQLKHTDVGGLSACDDGTGDVDPEGTGCCARLDVWCVPEIAVLSVPLAPAWLVGLGLLLTGVVTIARQRASKASS